MATGKDVIQGYTGVAAVDSQHQIIVAAQAHGTGAEQALLMPVLDALPGLLADDSVVTADAGYHSEDNLKQLAERQIDALIATMGRANATRALLGSADRHSRSNGTAASLRAVPQKTGDSR